MRKQLLILKVYSLTKVQNVSLQFGHDIYGRAVIHKYEKTQCNSKITYLTFFLMNGYLRWCSRATLMQLSAEEQQRVMGLLTEFWKKLQSSVLRLGFIYN